MKRALLVLLLAGCGPGPREYTGPTAITFDASVSVITTTPPPPPCGHDGEPCCTGDRCDGYHIACRHLASGERRCEPWEYL